MNNKKTILNVVLIVIAGILLAAAVFLITETRGVKKEAPSESSETMSYKEATDDITYDGITYTPNRDLKCILFLGVDTQGEVTLANTPGTGGMADSVNVLVFDKEKKSFFIIQVSRNTMVDVDIYDTSGNKFTTEHAQINSQYAYGDGKDKSCRLMETAVSNLLYQQPITGYVAMNITAIGLLNQAVGGVTITVPEDYTDVDPAFVKGATITLTDEQAEKYVRKRDIEVSGSNNDRMERQLQFMNAFVVRAKELAGADSGFLTTAKTLLDNYLVTDLTVEELKKYLSYDYATEENKVVPGETVQGEIYDEYHVDEDALYEMVLEAFYQPKN